MSDIKKVKRPAVQEQKPRTKLTPTNEERLKIILEQRARVVQEMSALKVQQDELNAEILDIVQTLDGADETWEGTDHQGHVHRAKVVRPESINYDEEELKLRLTPKVWDRVTDRVLNTKELQNAVLDGEVDADLVMETQTIQARKPYIKVTTK